MFSGTINEVCKEIAKYLVWFFITYPLYDVPLRQKKKTKKDRDTVKKRTEIEE